MRIVVSDSSCLIDLRKIELLPAFLQLPYEIVIPDVLFDDELVKFTDEQKAQLLAGGMKIVELPGDGVTRVIELNQANPRLSVHDCFAYVLAERTPDSVLLTGDGLLRTIAKDQKLEFRGVLWIIEELMDHGVAPPDILRTAVQKMMDDDTVRIPPNLLRALLRKLDQQAGDS